MFFWGHYFFRGKTTFGPSTLVFLFYCLTDTIMPYLAKLNVAWPKFRQRLVLLLIEPILQHNFLTPRYSS